MFNDTSSPLALLQTRRSGKPRDMIAPGPSEDQLRTILAAAMRVPDHGKLAPWRFVVINAAARGRFAALLAEGYAVERPDAGRLEREAIDAFAHQAPALVVVVSKPIVPHKIPLWEQQLSAGAACMTMLSAAHALGFVGGWLTGWAAYSPMVNAALAGSGGSIAGFVFIGSPSRPLEERPRPEFDDVVTFWG